MVKPKKYFNKTGRIIVRFSEELRFTPEECLLIQDDVHLRLGKLPTRARGSDGAHNRGFFMLRVFQTNEIPRLKIGVAPEAPPISMLGYLVSPFDDEAKVVTESAQEAAVQRLLALLKAA